MLLEKTPKKLRLLLALSPALLLIACGANHPRLAADITRYEPVPLPAVPEGEADCEGEPCLSDAQAGHLINALINVIEESNGKLLWLRDYHQPEGWHLVW